MRFTERTWFDMLSIVICVVPICTIVPFVATMVKGFKRIGDK